jgi:hypothetical protein
LYQRGAHHIAGKLPKVRPLQSRTDVRLRFIGTVVLAMAAALIVFVTTSTSDTSDRAPIVRIAKASRERVLAVFVDSLADRVASDAAIMPELVALGREGASFSVEPCRDRLTYLCLRSILTGYDDASLAAFYQNFERRRDERGDTSSRTPHGSRARAIRLWPKRSPSASCSNGQRSSAAIDPI